MSSSQQASQSKDNQNNAAARAPKAEQEQTPILESRPPGTIMPQARTNPGSLSSSDIAQLQRSGGNRAVSRLLSNRSSTTAPVQAKLTLGPANDQYEQEADQVAKQVVNGQNAVNPGQAAQGPSLQTKPGDSTNTSSGVSAGTESAIQSARGSGRALDNHTRSTMEQSFGADFSGVRVHTSSRADQLNQSLQSRAFTTGNDVFFRGGEYNPGSAGGKELLAHELTHTIQQGGSTVQRKPAANSTAGLAHQISRGAGAAVQRYFTPTKYGAQEGASFSSIGIKRSDFGSTDVKINKEITNAVSKNYNTTTEDVRAQTGAADPATSTSTGTGGPRLKVSENSRMAIEDTDDLPKMFYGDATLADDSNALLKAAGSNIRLKAGGGGSIKVPTKDYPSKPTKTLQMIKPGEVTGEDAMGVEQIDDLTQQAQVTCDQFVKYIIGSSKRVTVVGSGVNETELAGSSDQTATSITDFITQDRPGGATALGAHHEAGTAPSDTMKTDYGARTAPNTATNPNPHAAQMANTRDELKINEAANPNVGEGYVIRSVGGLNTESTYANKQEEIDAVNAKKGMNDKLDVFHQDMDNKARMLIDKWEEHFAGVVAKDDGDTVTLENYNRNVETRWEFRRIYNNLFDQFDEFQDFVWNRVAATQNITKSGDEIQDIVDGAHRAIEGRAGDMIAAYRRALEEAKESFATGIERSYADKKEMIHFRMYGSEEGQSFHEQFAKTTENPMTMRIRSSLELIREEALDTLAREENTCREALTKTVGTTPGVIALGNTMSGKVDTAVNLIRTEITGAASVGEVPKTSDILGSIRTLKETLREDVDGHVNGLLQPGVPIAASGDKDALLAKIDNGIADNKSWGITRKGKRQKNIRKALKALKNVVTGL